MKGKEDSKWRMTTMSDISLSMDLPMDLHLPSSPHPRSAFSAHIKTTHLFQAKLPQSQYNTDKVIRVY